MFKLFIKNALEAAMLINCKNQPCENTEHTADEPKQQYTAPTEPPYTTDEPTYTPEEPQPEQVPTDIGNAKAAEN